jgi:hypothetical protein
MKANPPYGRAQLEGLAAEAREHRLELIARQSEQLAASAKACCQSQQIRELRKPVSAMDLPAEVRPT